MNNILLIIGVIMALAIVIHAYSMGWDAGHDAGHEHEGHEPTPPPPGNPPIWR